MIKIFVFGITGKIGKSIINYLKLNKNFILLGGINKKNFFKLFNNKYNLIFLKMKKNSIFLDFSNLKILKKILFLSLKFNIPLIIGTTGLNIIHLNFIFYVSKKNCILLSYNMSIGINILNLIFININFYLKIYNFESFIIDIHHDKKKDSPSGTSLILYSKIKNINKKIFSARIKSIIGNHIVYFISNNEIIKIEHIVLNRIIFIIGVFYSILWLLNKKNGLYSMYDIYFKC
ncbi:4-hydroxy-tetrahydrodipicolinate reductase [Candidatus Carsonella ruddii]|uniref:Dihydrodipicolinate reductase n=1 Tax=Candidatus Carsonella ruddii HC isolate Thao2000 TaxID=1202538 RepID=J3TW40_CARRU|nr:dihydrodipicolinate reductase C-terminal domain-containing protein [Candidatus Carsonella ruddii]AFP83930.1 dihydrodipicolinate reductase [Candidatus Carsonella ruddii HC isolate Thao2000]